MEKQLAFALSLFWAAMALPAGVSASDGRLYICSGYGCTYRTRVDVSAEMQRNLASIMAGGRASAEAERQAIARAVKYFEAQATRVIGVADKPKAAMGRGGILGQMDCIDESTNTHALLKLISSMGMMRHHRVERNASRGFFVDMRYPHATAVIRSMDGRSWAVDSWYEPAGSLPDIMPLEEWRKRGVRGER